MGYSQGKKLTTTEKKLQALKLQLYGKETVKTVPQTQTIPRVPEAGISLSSPVKSTTISLNDTHYLNQDLSKILLLACLSLGAQLLLYISLNRGLIHF